ncbi:MAG TPA: DpnI domain-containing protein [Candidatus Acidoferrum sp.]|jgi:type II restriction enzyme
MGRANRDFDSTIRVCTFCRGAPETSGANRAPRWVGCNILLDKIPSDARIPIVNNGKPSSKKTVRDAYQQLRPLEKLTVERRGWTLDVLQAIQSLGKNEFGLADIYSRDGELAKLHPNNTQIRDKIRQQLQELRDLGLLEFLGGGSYRLR